MKPLLSQYSASINELTENPAAILQAASNSAIAILNHNESAAYLISVDIYEQLMEKLDDLELAEIVEARRSEKADAIEVKLDDL